jgi:hypothetical protein
MKCGLERTKELVVASRYGATNFDTVHHTLNAISLMVDAPVPTDNRLAAGLGRHDV